MLLYISICVCISCCILILRVSNPLPTHARTHTHTHTHSKHTHTHTQINQSINQSNIALLYIPEVALQSPVVIHTQSYRVWEATTVATAALGQTDRSVAANQRQRPLRPPPTFIHIHTMQCMYFFMMVGETGVPGVNPRRLGENMQTPHRKDLERPGEEPAPGTNSTPCRN